MNYLSTRNNHRPVSASEAIALGMVPSGGLFVPEQVPALSARPPAGNSYQDTARLLLSALLTDFSRDDIDDCIARAYNKATFDADSIVPVVMPDNNRSIMELWHGPTAAFKDVALQIMPRFLATAKRNTNDRSHTVILVATSGDTGKAALEGFKNAPGISLVVFYPHEGVSEIQRLQMATTDGDNTHVVAVRGNFDDCQRGVKAILGDPVLLDRYGAKGISFSSANSINWGRLCPQIVYYFTSYASLVKNGVIRSGDPVNLCVPTGNFGNILAGYYAYRMGLPVAKLICASNHNNVLTDFFLTGTYNSKRPFYRTMSPSMDILISSNLERFLFELTGHDATAITAWNRDLIETGVFEAGAAAKTATDGLIVPGWIDEPEVLTTIRKWFNRTGYVLDTHTAVAAALSDRIDAGGRH
ncbi:MAG: threonine synthase, partial [Chitinispirillaceae bacterium]|nr:threonine synthase [Chitinispirillaceae bacterium]